MRQFIRFWRKLCVISVLWEIFRRLNAISIAFYTPNATHAVVSVETSPTVRKMRPCTRFWGQTVRYIGPAGDISTFKRYFHRILHAECYTRRFQRRDKPNCAQNATIYSILTKTVRYIQPNGDISTFKRYFHRILHAEWYARSVQRQDKPNGAQTATSYSIVTKNCAIYRSCWRYFDV